MRKHEACNIFNVFLLTFIVISPSLFSMENLHLPLKELIVLYNISNLSHDTTCALALVDKEYNKRIENTAELRKNYLKNYVYGTYTSIKHKNTNAMAEYTFAPITIKIKYIKDYIVPEENIFIIKNENMCWHKYGSACSMIDRSGNQDTNDANLNRSKDSNSWTFRLIYFANKGFVKECAYYDYNQLRQWPANESPPVFNRKGDACLYRITSSEGIEELSLSPWRAPQQIPCFIDLQNSYYYSLRTLAYFMKFPKLLSAILASEACEEPEWIYEAYRRIDKKIKIWCDKNRKIKVYILDKVIIPDDYAFYQEIKKPFKEHIYLNKVKKFDDLSIDYLSIEIKSAIERRYKEQRGEKSLFERLFERLPKHIIEKNIGALLQGIGRAAFKCVSKTCYSKMLSQYELNEKYLLNKYNEDGSFFKECGAFEY